MPALRFTECRGHHNLVPEETNCKRSLQLAPQLCGQQPWKADIPAVTWRDFLWHGLSYQQARVHVSPGNTLQAAIPSSHTRRQGRLVGQGGCGLDGSASDCAGRMDFVAGSARRGGDDMRDFKRCGRHRRAVLLRDGTQSRVLVFRASNAAAAGRSGAPGPRSVDQTARSGGRHSAHRDTRAATGNARPGARPTASATGTFALPRALRPPSLI